MYISPYLCPGTLVRHSIFAFRWLAILHLIGGSHRWAEPPARTYRRPRTWAARTTILSGRHGTVALISRTHCVMEHDLPPCQISGYRLKYHPQQFVPSVGSRPLSQDLVHTQLNCSTDYYSVCLVRAEVLRPTEIDAYPAV